MRTKPMFLFLILCSIYNFQIYSQVSFQEAIDSLEAALPKAKEEEKLELYDRLIWEYKDVDLLRAMEYATEGESLARELGKKLELSRILNKKSMVLRDLANYPEAIIALQEALLLNTEINYQKGILNNNNSLGTIHYHQEEYGLAGKYYDAALTIALQMGDTTSTLNIYNNLGLIKESIPDYDSSIYYYTKAIELSRIIDRPVAEGVSQLNMANIYTLKGDIKRAISSARQSLVLFETVGKSLYQSYALHSLAGFYLQVNQLDSALYFSNKSLKVSNQLASNSRLMDAYQIHSEVLQARGDLVRALESKDRYIIYKDSVFNENKSQQVAELEEKYETEKKEQQIASLQLQKRNEELKRNVYAGRFFSVIVVGGFIAFGLWYRIKKNKQLSLKEQQIAAEKLQNLQTELGNYTLQLIDRSKRIEELNGELEKAKNTISGDCPSYKGTLDHLMQSTILTEHEWSQFKKLFSQVHPGFLVGVRQAYSDLTDTEERLLTLKKLNLTTREISSMLGISTDSVYKSKYRLRKKLNVNSEELVELVASF